MKSKFKKLMAAALVLCLVLALLPAAAFAGDDGYSVTYYRKADTETPIYGCLLYTSPSPRDRG